MLRAQRQKCLFNENPLKKYIHLEANGCQFSTLLLDEIFLVHNKYEFLDLNLFLVITLKSMFAYD